MISVSVIKPTSLPLSTMGNLLIFFSRSILLISENFAKGEIIWNSLSITSLTLVFFPMIPLVMSASLMAATALPFSTTTRLLTDFSVRSFAALIIVVSGEVIITSLVIISITLIILSA